VELKDYLRVLRKQSRLIAVVFLVAVTVSAALAYTRPKVYRSQIRLFVSAQQAPASTSSPFVENDAYSGQLLSAERVKSYAALIQGPRVSDDVAARVTCAGKPSLQASAPVETVLIDVAAVAATPACAQELSNAAGDAIIALVEELERPVSGPAPLRITVVERAKLPTAPIAPRKKIIVLMGIMFGLGAGLGLAMVREKLDTSVKDPDEVASATSAPVVGVIGYDQATPQRPVVVHSNPRSPTAEAFRQLRTNIRFVNIDRRLHSLIVTSAVAGEGKTSISCNLAIALAQAGQRVILVEADLRKPAVRTYMGIEGAAGLTNVLLGEVDVADVLHPWGDGTLRVLPGGPHAPNPSELLGSEGMIALVRRLESMADLVIFDTPPLLPVTDAAVLGVNTDGAVLVVRSGGTARGQLDRAVESLGGVGVRVIGGVLNMAPTKGSAAYHYYAYYGQDAMSRSPLGRLRGRLRRSRPAIMPDHPAAPEPAAERATSR